MADRYYIDMDLGPGEFELTGPEAHHLAVVCRVRQGEEVFLFNGRGEQYLARVLQAAKRSVILNIETIEKPVREIGYRLEVAVALPKGDRADFLVEKLTELGVTRLIPLQTARSVVHPRDTKIERLQRQVIEASKQCGRNWLMEIGEMVRWTDFITSSDLPYLKLLSHPGESLHDVSNSNSGDVVVAIGPEGGFAEEEVAKACEAGWQKVSLGPRILRIETAAIVMATRFNSQLTPNF